MKLDFFKERLKSVLIIGNSDIFYFLLKEKGDGIEILKGEGVEFKLFNQGIFNFQGLEAAINALIKKYKITELGVILHLPHILFQRITLPKTINQQEAILNYLKATFPLPLEKYSFYYNEDRYQLASNITIFNITFISKEIIENILRIIEKYNLIPLFISLSVEAVYQYLLRKTVIDFNEEYLVFFIDKKVLFSFLIKNLRIEKMIIEEIDLEKTEVQLIISRIYNFLKTNLSPEAKVMFLSQKPFQPEIAHQYLFLSQKPNEVLLEGVRFIFDKVYLEQEFIDFLPLKPYSAYFLNRLPSITAFLSIYLFSLIIIFSGFYFYLNSRLNNKITSLNKQLQSQIVKSNIEGEINNFIELTKKLDQKKLESFIKIKNILNLNGFLNFNFENNQTFFSLKIDKQNLEKTKFQISQDFPSFKLIQEETISENEVKLTYSF